MDAKEKRAMLACIEKLCARQGDIDAAVLAHHMEGLTAAQAQKLIDELEEEGLITVMEYGFSCSVETLVEGLTEKGQAFLMD